MPMQRLAQNRFDNAIEAEVQNGDTLQAIALRFRCSVAEIKRLNKIDKDNEIYARKTIKVPITPHSVLLETLPIIHKSGQSSPKRMSDELGSIAKLENQLENDYLSEKLMVASVVTSEVKPDSINNIILNSKLTSTTYTDNPGPGDREHILDSLLNDEADKTIPYPRPIGRPTRGNFECSGSDCDISWICLFICILALCFAIPLIYVLYIAENKFKNDELMAHNHSIQVNVNSSLSLKFSA